MLRLYAPQYLKFAALREAYASGFASMNTDPNAVLNDEQQGGVLEQMESIANSCTKMNLPVTGRTMEKIVARFRQTPPTHAQTRQKVMEWYSCFESEVETHLYLQVLPHRLQYWSAEPDGAHGTEITSLVETLTAFPDAIYDAREAGNCFAFERFTASVYHLMRVAEFGLISVAVAANAPQDKINKGWDGCIQAIEHHVKLIGSTKPMADWQDQIKKYSELCAWFTNIQKGWRNPVSHIPRIYSEGSAKGMFSAVATLFEHLTIHGFCQPIEMPQEIER